MMRTILCVVATLCWLTAGAAEIYVNGVKADGLTAQEFKNCTVKFDEKGAVHITAPGVKLLAEGAAPDPAKLSAQYFVALTLSQAAAGTIRIVVNGTEADAVKPGEKNKIVEITKFLRPGANKVLVMAGPEKAAVPVQVLIGAGRDTAGSLELAPTVDKQLSLSDKGLSETFDITAR